MRASLGPLVVFLAAISLACGGDSPSAPSPTPTPTPPPTPVSPRLTDLRVTGNNLLRSVGETSQLTATATFSDGTTRDVTADTRWGSSEPSRMGVSAGRVTVLALGMSTIWVNFQNIGTSIQMYATPPNTYVFYGRAREPGLSGLSGVRVSETMSNQSALTDQEGEFQFASLTAGRFKFEKEGYELVEIGPITPTTTQPGVAVGAALQKVVRIAAGSSLNGLNLAPHDLEYMIGSERCFPCKLVRVTSTAAGRLRFDATWSGSPNSLHVWLAGTRFAPSGSTVSAEATIGAGEVLVYVGFNLPANQSEGSYITFNVATALGAS